jgi:hypothetical protein
MFVLCPHCQFLVAVNPATGLPPPRCPRCDGVVVVQVDTAQTVAAEAPVEVQTEAGLVPAVAVAGYEEQVPEEVAVPAAPVATEAVDALLAEAEPEAGPAATAPRSAKPAPSFTRTAHVSTRAATPMGSWRQAAAIAALALLLLMQILFADRDQLAADARWRPALEAFCAALRCDLAPWREPAAITLLDRNVAPDPSHPGVLHVTASFRNDARWSQPWPRLVLTLSDVDGRVAGARAFEPREYLGHAVTKNGLASGHSANVAMDIVEPAPRIVAFTFDFR